MQKNLKLQSQKRTKKEKPTSPKTIPAIIYGGDLKQPQSLWIDKINFIKTYTQAGESTLINLTINNKNHKVLIYDIQYEPLRGEPIHVDFFKVTMTEKLDAEVELIFQGEAPAIKELGGILVKNINSVEVRCLPADLPSEIKIDISTLKTFEDRICINDLPIEKNKIEINLEPETVIALVTHPRSQEELEKLNEKTDSADLSQIESSKKKPEKDEEGEK